MPDAERRSQFWASAATRKLSGCWRNTANSRVDPYRIGRPVSTGCTVEKDRIASFTLNSRRCVPDVSAPCFVWKTRYADSARSFLRQKMTKRNSGQFSSNFGTHCTSTSNAFERALPRIHSSLNGECEMGLLRKHGILNRLSRLQQALKTCG